MTNMPRGRTHEEFQSAFKIDGEPVGGHLNELVRSAVEVTLSNLLDAAADQLLGGRNATSGLLIA